MDAVNSTTTLLAVLSMGTAALTMMDKFREGYRQRAKLLTVTGNALEKFYAAVDQVIDDPALPDDLAELLYDLGRFISDRKLNEMLVDGLMRGREPSAGSRADTNAWAVNEALKRSRPDVYDAVHQAIGSGLIVAFLRWPENARRFEEFSARYATEKRRDAQIEARISELRNILPVAA